MRRTDIENDKGESLAGPSPFVAGPPSGHAVIPFRKADTSAASGFAAGGDPPSPPANFEPLGQAVSAVILRIRNSRLRLKVTGPGREDDRDQL
ncbi:hypothetical protein Rleg2_2451 [Rhizobium leguminosarum bv. trifolii WSM2304]|uniref:Uncharacterized protein n=1 Tax=Rhizobium leguminosarum bv. trifolii (strain WSM2304) TaxID=395492 RepID=A0ABF7QNK1_RHILW|nr:hypothetical protein [Rhizobium leguminosarum]ACI55725.1 hypothetical protein Rleg2_2451 [Rhizobium leguminosarum bv. trifolii WSM2304]